MAKRKTIFGKILGKVTNVAGGVVGNVLGVGDSLQNLGIGAKGESSPLASATVGGAVAPKPVNLNDYITLPSVKVEAEKDNLFMIVGAVLGGVLLLKLIK